MGRVERSRHGASPDKRPADRALHVKCKVRVGNTRAGRKAELTRALMCKPKCKPKCKHNQALIAK